MDVLLAETVLRAILDIGFGCIDDEDSLAVISIFLVQHDDTGGYTGSIEQVRRQANDPLDIAALNKVLPDLRLGITAKQHTVGQDDSALTLGLHRAGNMQ